MVKKVKMVGRYLVSLKKRAFFLRGHVWLARKGWLEHSGTVGN